LSVIGCWLLVIGCWLLVVGCWLLVVVDKHFITSASLVKRNLWGNLFQFYPAGAGLQPVPFILLSAMCLYSVFHFFSAKLHIFFYYFIKKFHHSRKFSEA